VPKLRSVSSIVIAPARTGSDKRISHAVMKIDQANSGTLCMVMPGARMLRKVVIILIAPRIEDAPDRCTAKIARSIENPCSLVERGGYSTQPTPDPVSPSPPGAKTEATANDVPAM
jgi:hypothetical protein